MTRPTRRDGLWYRTGSLVGAALLVGWALVWVCGGVACQSAGSPGAGAPEAGTPEAVTTEGDAEPATAPEGAGEGLAGTAPSAGEVSEASLAASTAGETAPGTRPIRPSTRRTSEGLPSALAGYQTWYRLDPAVSPPSRGPHLKISRTYILLPDIHKVETGDRVEPPFPEGTLLVLETKSSSTDYIEAISMMERTADSWKFQEFARPRAESAFQPGESQAGTCAGCHAQAPADSVFAQLELR